MKIVFCWMTVSGYMADCWRELSRRPDVELFVVAFESTAGANSNFSGAELMQGVDCRLLSASERSDQHLIRELVLDIEPDVLVLSGWSHAPYLELAYSKAINSTPMIIAMDNPRAPGFRQWMTRLAYRPYLRRMDKIFVTGERCWLFARYLGFQENQIVRGATYGVDCKGLALLEKSRRESGEWPRSFLFVGQYTKRKGVDVLLRAYREYRDRVEEPWSLVCCGMGPLEADIRAAEGVSDRGFVQPHDLREERLRSGAFVLPSRSDAWGMAIVEGGAAGLPVICSNACGAAVETVGPLYSGVVVSTEDASALTDAFEWVHEQEAALPEIGRRAMEFAAAYSVEAWADRIVREVTTLVGSKFSDRQRSSRNLLLRFVARLRSLMIGA